MRGFWIAPKKTFVDTYSEAFAVEPNVPVSQLANEVDQFGHHGIETIRYYSS